jgi:quercetin dioxygenase-like cupin family protein
VSDEVVLRAPGEGETITDRPAKTVRILTSHDLADVTWSRYEAGERGPDPHVHRHHTDSFYVLEGELEFGVGPEVTPVRAPAGTFVLVPELVVHTFGNESGATATYLNFHAPSGGFASYLRKEDADFDNEDPPADGGRAAEAVVVSGPGDGERFDRGNRLITLKGDAPQVSVNEIEFDTDFVVDPHRHDDEVDSFYVLDGVVEFTLEDGVVRAEPGTWLSAPPGSLHGFRNPGTGRARILNVHTPDAEFADSVRGFEG